MFGVLSSMLVLSGIGWANRTWLEGEFQRLRYFLRHHHGVLLKNSNRELSPGMTFKDCNPNSNDCPEMVVVPAGKFVMGASVAERHEDNRLPQHKVTIAKPFAVGKFEVTFDQWDACVAYGGCPTLPDHDWGRGNQPVVNVTWSDAVKYVEWLAKVTGKPYRLLSESEWEYAARAGTTTKYHWGDRIGDNNANCVDCGSKWDLAYTAPVGSFKPNAFGLHDMHGNVWEWVQDCRTKNYIGAPTDGAAIEVSNCRSRVLRGGSWGIDPVYLTSDHRGWAWSDIRDYKNGFRVARNFTILGSKP